MCMSRIARSNARPSTTHPRASRGEPVAAFQQFAWALDQSRRIDDLLVACEIHPLNNLRTLQHLKRALGQNEEQINAWYRHWIADGLAKLEADLNRVESGGGAGRPEVGQEQRGGDSP